MKRENYELDNIEFLEKGKNLTFFDIADTPLAENEEQLELIQEQLPEVNIYK